MPILAAIALALFALLAGTFRAWPHEAAAWIQRGEYKNALGELCCGERDCARLDDGDVVPKDGGYLIQSRNEFVPIRQATPASPDGYWLCVWSGMRKCFFVPITGS